MGLLESTRFETIFLLAKIENIDFTANICE